MKKTLAFSLALGMIAATAAASHAAAKDTLVRGTIVSFTPTVMTVKTSTGTQLVTYGPKVTFLGALPGSVADVVPGAFLGIANVPGADSSRALEVTVFDAKLRGVGEGDGPWQAPGTAHAMMTNGTVAKPRTMMTNGTVGTMQNGAAKTIVVNYKGGSRKILVLKTTPVIRVAPGSPALIAKGASVFIDASTAGGALAAKFAVVGRNGTTLPL